MRVAAFVIAMALAWPAFAQGAPPAAAPPATEPPVADMQRYVAKLIAQRDEYAKRAANLEAEMEAIVAGYRTKLADTVAYARACGGAASCWSAEAK